MMDAFTHIPIADISVRANIRKTFDESKLQELAESIRENGVIEPLIVRVEVEEGKRFELVAGERRLRAAKMAGLDKVPCRVMSITREQAAQIQLLENLQREDLDPVEEAQALKTLTEEHGYSQQALAAKLGVSQPYIAHRVRLLRLPEDVLEAIQRRIISPTTAEELLRAEKLKPAFEAAKKEILEEGLSSREAARKVDGYIRQHGRPVSSNYYVSARPEFDVGPCQNCANAVRIKEPYNDKKNPFCLDVECWDRKQEEVIAARRAAALARTGKDVVDLSELNYNDYQRFDEANFDTSECQGCEHRRYGAYSWSAEPREICMNLKCFSKKKAAATRQQRAAEREQEKQEMARIEEIAATRTEETALSDGTTVQAWLPEKPVAAALEKRDLVFLAGILLTTVAGEKLNCQKYLKGKFGWTEFGGTWYDRNAGWPKFREALESLSNEQLTRLVVEYPMLALGMKGIVAWYAGEPEPETTGDDAVEGDDDDVRRCRVCGCTDEYGCDGGCEWVEEDLCSACEAEGGYHPPEDADLVEQSPVDPPAEDSGAAYPPTVLSLI